MSRKLAIKTYRNALTPKQAAEGMNAAARNAKRLYEDAKALFDSKRYPSACSLAILSIEESGKLSILREVACATNKGRINESWRRYSDHRDKNAQWLSVQLMMGGARALQDFAQVFDRKSDHTDILNIIKQLGFYTDCYGEAHWSEPEKVIDEEMARSIVTTAGILVPKRETTEREMELWAEHIGAHWGKPDMLKRAIAFEEALIEEGLRDTPIEDVKAFYGITV
jgi:AbiV family abortive infection protein